MAMPQTRTERIDFLTERAIKFFNIYGDELESISQVLKIRLGGLASAYTVENNLPREAIVVHARVKSLTSFLKKLEKLEWPKFGHPTEVITDLIGARVICWFVDDCYGMLEYLQATRQFLIKSRSLEDYIRNPKPTGYRAIHILADVSYDRLKTYKKRRAIVEDRMICEIQIRSKLQNAWSEFTHEVHRNVSTEYQEDYDKVIANIARNLAVEDKSAMVVRDIIQKQFDKKELDDFRYD
jgi:putative GTP pyrophosphokinase